MALSQICAATLLLLVANPACSDPSGAVAATADGITYTIGAAGDCTTTPPVAAGDSVYLEYVARATDPSTGEQQIFDATRTKFRPAMRFQVDNDTSVIPGMHQGVVGMCAGEKRNLVIPSRLAYAGDGAGSMIKPHATLIFDMELTRIVSKNTMDKLHESQVHIDACVHSGERKDVLDACLAAGLHPDTVSQDGRSFICSAAFSGGFESVKRLIQLGGNVNLALPNGVSPLMYASGEGHTEIVTELLAEGAHVDAAVVTGAMVGYRALHFATMLGRYDNVVSLLKAGAEPHPKAGNGKTPVELLREFVANKGSLKKSKKSHHENAVKQQKDVEKLFEIYSTKKKAAKKDEL